MIASRLSRFSLSLLAAAMAASSLIADVVINEIHYNAPNDMEDLEYVELHNTADQPVDVSGWKFTKGLRYTFPANTKISAHGYVVLCRNQERFKEYFGFSASGAFGQPLSNKGERIELANAQGEMVDSVKYDDEAPWPTAPDGHSASLERITPLADSNLPQNWAGSPLSDDPLKPSGTPGKQNASFSPNLPPLITKVSFSPSHPAPDQPVTVEADVRDKDGLKQVTLRYRLARPGAETEEAALVMKELSEGRFTGTIPGQKSNQIVRFRIQAVDEAGSRRIYPAESEPRPALSFYVYERTRLGKIPAAYVINVGEGPFKAAERHRQNPNRGPFSEEGQVRWMAQMTLESMMDLPSIWWELAFGQGLEFEALGKLRPILSAKLAERDKLIQTTLETPNLREKMATLPQVTAPFNTQLAEAIQASLSAEQSKKFGQWQQQQQRAPGGPPQFGPETIVKQFIKLEGAFFSISTSPELAEAQFKNLRSLFLKALQERNDLTNAVRAVMTGAGDWSDVQEKIAALEEKITRELKPLLTADQSRKFSEWQRNASMSMPGQRGSKPPQAPQGESALVFVDQRTHEATLFDFVNVTDRNAGYKVYFHQDQPLRGMTTVNLIFEYNDRFVLAEPLAYELYRRAGNAAPLTEFVRLSIDGQQAGYHLLVEQPNRAFLQRNKLKGDGNLYKILWYQRGVVGQHEKKTNRQSGHEDVVKLVELLEKSKGGEQWAVIKKHFNVEQVINYFAVNTCLSHWDGFFNNYFTYHDVGGTGKWEMYPWDQDKTWGFHDGIQGNEIFYDMPLTFGMEGDVPPGHPKDRPPPRGFGGRSAWWRPGGYFSKPLLANPHFRKHYLARTKEILETIYTEEIFFPIIDSLKERLQDEVNVRAEAMKEDADRATQRFQRNVESLREHLQKRRRFLLAQEELQTAGKFIRAELK